MKEVVDRIVQYPNRYKLTDVSTGQDLGTYDFTEVPGTVQQEGTEINAELFESIEQDIENAGNFNPNGTYPDLTAGEATHAQSADTATSAESATDAVNAQLAVKATRDAAGNNIQSTYATKTDLNTKANQTALDGVINGTTPVAKATTADSATNATNATKATNDGQGRNIASTYALKSEAKKYYTHVIHVKFSSNPDEFIIKFDSTYNTSLTQLRAFYYSIYQSATSINTAYPIVVKDNNEYVNGVVYATKQDGNDSFTFYYSGSSVTYKINTVSSIRDVVIDWG